MAAVSLSPPAAAEEEKQTESDDTVQELYRSYLGVSFAVFLSLLPDSTISLLPTLHSRNRYLALRLRNAEAELTQLRCRRQEDSKANARVVEIFATHRHTWQQEERRLLRRLDDAAADISGLRERVSELEAREGQLIVEMEELRREVGERDEMLNFMSRHQTTPSRDIDDDEGGGGGQNEEFESVNGEDRSNANMMFGDLASEFYDGFDPHYVSSGSKFWNEQPNPWQDVHYETFEPMRHAKQFVVRRESPWKVDGESTGVPSKLKLLEEELLNLEKISKSSPSKVASSMRKQARRYQDLAGKIDDLCKRMQASDPSESALNSEYRSQRQTEFLLEAFQLQQRASETGKRLTTIQTEIYTSCIGNEIGIEAKFAMRRSLDTIRSNFKEIQRNLEVWLARIMGDLEGILARDGGATRVRDYARGDASRVRDYYFPRNPYVNNFS